MCPNGHKLHGPASLQGKPGQCPHCKSRFLIPFAHGDAEPELEPDFEHLDLVSAFESAAGWEEPSDQVDAALAEDDVDDVNVCDEPPPPPLPKTGHPLAEIIRKLWAEARGAGTLEVQVTGGAPFLAESFSPELSQREYGVFAVRDEKGDEQVTILPWSDVRQVVVRGLGVLPREWFRVAATNRRAPDQPQ